MNLNNLNSPFYAVYAFLFLSLAWTTSGFFKDASKGPAHVLWLMSTLTMALACVGLALLPQLGKTILGFSSFAMLAAAVFVYLIWMAWRRPLSRRLWRTVAVSLGLIFLGYNSLLHFSSAQMRVLFLLVPVAFVLVWGVYEAGMLVRVRPSLQQKLTLATQLLLMGVVLSWMLAKVLMQDSDRMAATDDPVSVAVGRLALVSLILVLMVCTVGVAVEKLRIEREKLLEDKLQADALNQKMAWTLQERNQMLKALTFSPKARNAHALVSNLAHEMNPPLGSIRLHAEQLVHSPQMPLKDSEDLLRKIVQGTERAQQSLRDFRLFFSTPRQADLVVQLDDLTREILDTFSGELHEADIEVTLDIQAPLSVEADVAQLKMVVLNLLTNAMDALRDHLGPRQLHIRLWRDSSQACFSIMDSGPGVPVAWHDKLFTSYFSTKEFGVGLGLWLCRAIVEYYGGAMTAALDGPGARFEFNMPLAAGSFTP